MAENTVNSEKDILNYWEKEKIYDFNEKEKGIIFSIDTPPPTVSGDMHVGHAFSYSQQDFIARFWRMRLCGKGQVFYPFGTDDNGLPTERLVEKINNVKSKDMPRTDFIKLCLWTLRKITPDFVQQWKNLGISADFGIFYSTIDKNSRMLSQKSFIDLYKKRRIYKKDFPTIWCVECQTAIAQAELEDKELQSKFLTIKFFVDGTKEKDSELLISTTRPELIPSCVAIFVNPNDKRYYSLKGKSARIPLFDFTVPIIHDGFVDMEKGTGAMMVCSYGDKYDVEAIQRHKNKLNPRIIFNQNGTVKMDRISELLKEKNGKDAAANKNDLLKILNNAVTIKDFRKIIYELLKSRQFIVREETIKHVVNVHDKCGTEIEFLPTEQWFIKILDKKKEWISLGKKIKWHPEYMRKRYENWVNGLEWDWTISRNRHFGVPIPVWQCKSCGEIILPDEKDLPIDPVEIKMTCSQCKGEAEAENKVLDTWATSPLTLQITSLLVGNKVKIPYSLRPQAHDIIRTWAFYTIVKSYFHKKRIPWKNIMISGFVTLGGEKMSKSKGIAINPNEIIEKYGADALRFWAAGSKLGENLDYREEDVLTGKRFITKLRNAANFVFINLKDYKPKKPKKIEKDDIEFLGKLNEAVKDSTENFLNYEYSKARASIEKFFWNDFCDNYLEFVKKIVYQGSEDKKQSVKYTLYRSLLTILKLISPIMPFVTEELYQKYFKKHEKEKSIHLSKWPEEGKEKYKGDWEKIKEYLSKINQFKTRKQLPLNAKLEGYKVIIPIKDYKIINNYLERFMATSGAMEIKSGNEFKIEENKNGQNHETGT